MGFVKIITLDNKPPLPLFAVMATVSFKIVRSGDNLNVMIDRDASVKTVLEALRHVSKKEDLWILFLGEDILKNTDPDGSFYDQTAKEVPRLMKVTRKDFPSSLIYIHSDGVVTGEFFPPENEEERQNMLARLQRLNGVAAALQSDIEAAQETRDATIEACQLKLREEIDELVAKLETRLQRCVRDVDNRITELQDKLHFVTEDMGGLRAALGL